MSDKAKAMERLIQSVVTGEKLRTATNAELADLMREHVWASLMMCSAVADLVGEVMDRLRGLKTCASCHGWGYVEHARCIPCGGTGDVAPPADAKPSLDALAREVHEWAERTFPGTNERSKSEHLRREAQELADAPTDPEEMADVFILLANLSGYVGVNLAEAVAAKHAKNKARKWGKPDAHGVIEHVRETPPADAAPLTSDFHTSCDWCKRDIPNACYAVLCSDCDRRGNTALFAPPADAATEALSRQFIEELRQRAYGPGKWSNDLEGDFGTWEAWRAALVEFAGRSRDAEGGGRG